MIQFYNMDCKNLMRKTPSQYYDLAIVDAPYFDDNEKITHGGSCDKNGIRRRKYTIFLKEWEKPDKEYWRQLFRISRHQIIFGINYFDIVNPGPGRIVWDKVNDTGTKFSDCEIAYCSMIKNVQIFRYMWSGMLQGSMTSPLRPRGNKATNERRIHPTQKPVALYGWIFNQFTQPNWRIIDTHGGSMSVAIAAHDCQRHLDVCEIDPDCFNQGKVRFESHINQLQLNFGE